MKKKNNQLAFSVISDGEGSPSFSTVLDLPTLEAHLWESANILRGPVDAADFKTYIFPLLFFKRISDVYDEEVAKALEESSGNQEYAFRFSRMDGEPTRLEMINAFQSYRSIFLNRP